MFLSNQNDTYEYYDQLPKFLKRAREARLQSDHPQHKLGAVLVQKNRIISVGANFIQKTHPITKAHDKTGFKTLHAEVNCLLKLKKNKEKLYGATIIVYRQNKQGQLSMARPCEMCRSILKSFGISKMIYTVNGGWKEECLE